MDSSTIAAITTFSQNKHIGITVLPNMSYTIKRTVANTEAFFSIPADSSLTLTGNGSGTITLDGGAVWDTGGPPSRTNSGLTASAALVRGGSGGGFTMHDGVILQNKFKMFSAQDGSDVDLGGGAVLVHGTDAGDHGTFTMTGGKILNNTSYHAGTEDLSGRGGGVKINKYAVFTMSGNALVDGNYIHSVVSTQNKQWGGGVYVGHEATFNFNGGTIGGTVGNYAHTGGGIFVDGTLNVSTGAKITNNAVVVADGNAGDGKQVAKANGGTVIGLSGPSPWDSNIDPAP
jgi:hypothetical protein